VRFGTRVANIVFMLQFSHKYCATVDLHNKYSIRKSNKMKLNQLGLTPSGMKATKKLTKQVHKATVAAAKEPKLKLGVIGIEIGQEQSTGDTSTVVSESVGSKLALLKKISRYLNDQLDDGNFDDFDYSPLHLSLDLREGNQEHEEQVEDAVAILSDASGSLSNHFFGDMQRALRGINESCSKFDYQISNLDPELFSAETLQKVQMIGAAATASYDLYHRFQSVEHIAQFLEYITNISHDPEFSAHHPFIKAVLVRLGLK